MSHTLPNEFFQEKPRDRGLKFYDILLPQLADICYRVSPLQESLPQRDFPTDLEHGLSNWIKDRGNQAVILNLGSGESTLSTDLISQRRVQVVDADLYPPTLVQSPNYTQQDANQSLKFANGQFDFVIASFLISYLEDPAQTVNEMIRVCKPGGYVLFNGGNKLSVDGMNFFGTDNLDGMDLVGYNSGRWGDGDWALFQVLNPQTHFDAILDKEESITVSNQPNTQISVPVYGNGGFKHEKRDIADLARFVYHKR